MSGTVTFKGNELHLVGECVKAGDSAPDFALHYYKDGMQTLKLADVKGKPTLLSIVPSLDTGVCAIQTKRFNEKLSEFGDKINAVTVSLDLPFAQGRFCGAEGINMQAASDYQTRDFGKNYGVLIDELKLLARAVVILDADGKVAYAEIVPEVTNEPDYAAALEALKGCC